MKTLQKRQNVRKKSAFDKALVHLGVHMQIQECLADNKQEKV